MGLKYRIKDSVFIPYLRINFKELKFNINVTFLTYIEYHAAINSIN